MLEARTETVDTNYGDEQAEMADYLRAGEKRALALGNRGPMRFNADGSLAEEILKAYWRCGFYVFTGVFEKSELADIEADVNDIHERARMIAYGIDARRQRFPAEEAYVYEPFIGQEDQYRWNDTARAAVKDYNLLDLSI